MQGVCAAAKPFLIEAYQQRFVALEVFYLGWRYHGFASQCETEGTVEVRSQPAEPCSISCCLKNFAEQRCLNCCSVKHAQELTQAS